MGRVLVQHLTKEESFPTLSEHDHLILLITNLPFEGGTLMIPLAPFP